MPTCKKCGIYFPNWVTIDGKKRDLHRRKYCLDCSPFGQHNTKPLIDNKLSCIVCGKKLIGKQSKYCSKVCKVKTLSSYPAQKSRGITRRIHLLEMAGGVCSSCGYDKNLAALQFHHLSPEEKLFRLDARNVSNRTWESVLKEAGKCILVCANCHFELHNPSMDFDILREKYTAKIEELK